LIEVIPQSQAYKANLLLMQDTAALNDLSSLQLQPYRLEDWRGGNCSLKEEFDYWIDDVEGEIPHELHGTLFRNGPGLLDVGGVPLKHPFDGDGMICAIAFDQGRAHFRNRFVRTEGYLAEQAAGKILYRGVFGTQKPGGTLANAFDLRLKNVANTQVIYWGGKLLALWEAAQPYRLDPATLETLGKENLEGVLQEGSPFAAHPLVDPAQDHGGPRLVNFAVKPGLSSTISIYELNQAGEVVQQQVHSVPGFAFIHDFAITPHYYLFFQNPILFNPLPYLLGFRGPGECLNFRSHRPTRIWVIPREPSGKVQALETEACFVFHHANAFEQGDELVVDSICYENFPAVDHKLDYREIDFATLPPGQIWRFHLNLKTEKAERQLLDPRCCEFPFVHPQCLGQPYRYVFLGAAAQAEGNAPLQAMLKLDLDSGAQDFWSAAPHGFIGEPIFVPRSEDKWGSVAQEQNHQAAQEDDGWILALVYDATHHRSDVVILDAAHLSKGPIARLHLKHHVPYGLHGSFTPTVF
jgi:all-trans-8'-apo-beta-carotenal 15,15'-oxygenase